MEDAGSLAYTDVPSRVHLGAISHAPRNIFSSVESKWNALNALMLC